MILDVVTYGDVSVVAAICALSIAILIREVGR